MVTHVQTSKGFTFFQRLSVDTDIDLSDMKALQIIEKTCRIKHLGVANPIRGEILKPCKHNKSKGKASMNFIHNMGTHPIKYKQCWFLRRLKVI